MRSCYEERYRWTGRVATGLACCAAMVLFGIYLSWAPVFPRVVLVALSVVVAVLIIVGPASRKVAFRIDDGRLEAAMRACAPAVPLVRLG